MGRREEQILVYLQDHPNVSSMQVFEGLQDQGADVPYTTLRRLLKNLDKQKLISIAGRGRGTRYSISKGYQLVYPLDAQAYLAKPLGDRNANTRFNFELISSVLDGAELFTDEEIGRLEALQAKYAKAIEELNANEYQKALETLSIDLSWKSSEIEGNTYTLLETESLLKEQKTAGGKTLEEANMLLNHKDAIDYLLQNQEFLESLSIRKIEHLHSILVENLGIRRNIRTRAVTVGGTDYKPLDNEFQIKEAVQGMCDLINKRENVFEKALIALLLLSYIQAFSDGNKRTARIVSNGILINRGYCPISFRTVDPNDYKGAMLIFYEQNNLNAFKQIFIEQFKYAVENYF